MLRATCFLFPCVVAWLPSAFAQSTQTITSEPNTPVAGATTINVSVTPRAIWVGQLNNVAFTVQPASPEATQLLARFDYADCSKGQERLLAPSPAELKQGIPTWVDYVDVELAPLGQQEIRWSGGVCYGTRTSDGKWHWRLASVPLQMTEDRSAVRARVWIKEPGIDAVKLIFDNSVPRHELRRIRVVTFPRIPPPVVREK